MLDFVGKNEEFVSEVLRVELIDKIVEHDQKGKIEQAAGS